MKIKAVVVDELPEGCAYCVLSVSATVRDWDDQEEWWLCPVTLPQRQLSEDKMLLPRPSWCPLVPESEE